MRILIAHVQYREIGGEDVVVATESRILRDAGHDVEVLNPRSSDFDTLHLALRIGIGASGGMHGYGRAMVARRVREFQPEVVHFHNLYPLLGTGAMVEAARLGCGVVQTLHNYRLTCAAGTHLLHGSICERCSLGSRLPGIVHRCYRHSLSQSAAMAFAVRRQVSALHSVPDVLVPLTRFAASRLVRQGVDPERIRVKPNSVDPGCGGGFYTREGVACIARISPEKGVVPLVQMWPTSGPPLVVAGAGPLDAFVAAIAERNPNVRYLGPVSHDVARQVIRRARVLAVPSPGFEGMPLAVLEAFAEGTPALFLGQGIRSEIIGESVTACQSLDQLVEEAHILHESEERWRACSDEARSLFETQFTHSINVHNLEEIYRIAIERRRLATTSRV